MARPTKGKLRGHRQNIMGKAHAANRRNHLTMQQEARNTEDRKVLRNGSCLRHKAVRFVSAGDLQPNLKDTTILAENTEDGPEKSNILTSEAGEHAHTSEFTAGALDLCFFVDLTGERLANTGFSDPISRSPPISTDESSEDEIVFHGRQQRSEATITFAEDTGFEHHNASNSLPTQQEISGQESLKHKATSRARSAMKPLPSDSPSVDDHNSPIRYTSFADIPHSLSKEDIRAKSTQENEVLADYLENVDDEYGDFPGALQWEQCHITHNTSQKPKAQFSLPNKQSNSNRGKDTGFGYSMDSHAGVLSNVKVNENILSDSGTDDGEIESVPYETKSDDQSPRFQQGYNCPGLKFASATAFADALELDPYYGFDIMDFNRSSLKTKIKGKQHTSSLALSGDEFGSELEQAWQKDREKKKARKQKRNQLRSEGLLGRTSKVSNPKEKYSGGMSLEDLKFELRLFMLSSKNSLTLPPMPKQRRKLIHEMADSLSLKSKSRGKGLSRFPILIKTSRTPSYDHKTIHQVDNIFSKGQFRQRALKVWDQAFKTPTKACQVRAGGSASYVEGDIVGASAPEIGAENKGRAMLEKMGWSIGTPLGAGNNKGILIPVAHVVKKSKAGLG